MKSVQSLQGRHKNDVIKLFAKIVNEGVPTFGKVGFIFLNENPLKNEKCFLFHLKITRLYK